MLDGHLTFEDKNPDVIPQEPTSDDEFLSEEKAFDRLDSEKMFYGSDAAHPLAVATSDTHAALQSILNSATLNRQHVSQNRTKVTTIAIKLIIPLQLSISLTYLLTN